MRIIISFLILLLTLNGLNAGAKEVIKDQGFNIEFDQALYNETKVINLQGSLSTFVNCGSQYATWRQFPRAVNYTIKNLDTNEIYNSIDMQLSISEEGNYIFDKYAKEPCDTVVSKDFFASLDDIYFEKAPKANILNFELQTEYAGHKSNVLIFKN